MLIIRVPTGTTVQFTHRETGEKIALRVGNAPRDDRRPPRRTGQGAPPGAPHNVQVYCDAGREWKIDKLPPPAATEPTGPQEKTGGRRAARTDRTRD